MSVFAQISPATNAPNPPQFEGTPKEVPGGFVRDEATRQMIIDRVKVQAAEAGFTLKNAVDSAVKGRKGNQECFFWMKLSDGL